MNLIVTACRALASKPRLGLLRAAHNRPGRTVQGLAALTGLAVVDASKHLRVLRGLKWIRAVPNGREVRCWPARPDDLQNALLRELLTLVNDLFASGDLKRTLAQVCARVPRRERRWTTVFAAFGKQVTAFTHLRRLLILRWIAARGAAGEDQIIHHLAMSADAARRHLDKLRRRGLIAPESSRPTSWRLIDRPRGASRCRLLEIILRAVRTAAAGGPGSEIQRLPRSGQRRNEWLRRCSARRVIQTGQKGHPRKVGAQTGPPG